MKQLTSKEIRSKWLDFWEKKGHEIIPSKSLIPNNDPSLLWINSGVATLKDYFSGNKLPKNPRIANSQKSIRTNDIENVGVTARHHTFFEMLGNFSIGDYFKDQAIEWAFELLTKEFEFDQDKLYFTYYEKDMDTYKKWISLGIKPSHLIKGNREMNFWDIGQGPCGPDTEIFYDRGAKYDFENKGIELLEKDLENDRYVEIWNIVFSQFNNDGQNNYTDLAQKNIDTGAGLERIVAIFQDAPTNFDTDLFLPIIKAVEGLSNNKYEINNYFKQDKKVSVTNKHFRIIADHLRAVSLAIQDGAKPSNTQRGYIIRRLIRRAYRSGLQLGINEESFLYKLVPVVQEILEIYKVNIAGVSKIIRKEELAFAKTIKQGEEILKKYLMSKPKELDFAIAFKLFETYGFPIELTKEILSEKNIHLDISQFEKYQAEHAKASRSDKKSGMKSQIQVIQEIKDLQSKFIGYDEINCESKVILSKEENDLFYTLLNRTTFYPTGGGQHADIGTLNEIDVKDVFRDKHENIWHITDKKIEGQVSVIVNDKMRLRKSANHSATHLLGTALRNVFGKSIKQLGSDNDENRLRFDFPLDVRPDITKINEVEKLVNKYIDMNIPREYIETSFKEGKNMGAITLEGEEYSENVRVVKFDNIIEFCGGTHVESTSQIEKFKIVKFESKGSGIFRIEGITTNNMINKYLENEKINLIDSVKLLIPKIQGVDSNFSIAIPNEITKLNELVVNLKVKLKNISKKNSQKKIDTNIELVKYDGNDAYINLNVDSSIIKSMAITLRDAHPRAIIIIGSTNNKRTTLAVASTEHDAKTIFDSISAKFNGRGGGNNNFAMGNMEEVTL